MSQTYWDVKSLHWKPAKNTKMTVGLHMTDVFANKRILIPTANGLTSTQHCGTWSLLGKLELIDVHTVSVCFTALQTVR